MSKHCRGRLACDVRKSARDGYKIKIKFRFTWSSIRSASSRMRNWILLKVTWPRSAKSSSLPGLNYQMSRHYYSIPARGGHQDVAAPPELGSLVHGLGAAVEDGGLDVGAGGELASLLADLNGELPGRRDDDSLGCLGREADVGGSPCGYYSVDDGEEEGGSLATACLSAGHQVSACQDDRHTMLLDWSRNGVIGPFHVLQHHRGKP